MALPAVNWIAVIGATIATMVIGAIWYSPDVFGKKWMKLAMRNMPKDKKSVAAAKEKMQQGMMKGYALTFLTTLLTAYVLALFVGMTQAITFGEGVMIGFWIWLGFVATNIFGGYIWEKDPIDLFLLKAGYNLVIFAVMGGILAVWV